MKPSRSNRHRREPSLRCRFKLTLDLCALALEDRTLLGVVSASSPAASTAASVQSAYGNLPLSFEPNQGQSSPDVQYLAHGAGYSLFLTPSGAVFNLDQAGSTGPATDLGMALVGAKPASQVTGDQPLPGKTNYLVGDDPSQWRTNIPTFGQVTYHDVYSGIDLDYHGSQGQLEYDFQVAPGADPGQVMLDFPGANSLELDGQGNLVVHTANGDVIQDAPVIYQDVAGTRHIVSGGYVLEPDDRVGFQLGTYDLTQPLVIDPVFVYSTYLGGLSADVGSGIAVDPAGDAYITGFTESTNLPGSPIAVGGDDVFVEDAFVIKLNPAGTQVIYSTLIGGGGDLTQGNAIAVDAAGDAYIAGYTGSKEFPLVHPLPTNTALGGIPDGSGQPPFPDAFVAMLDPTGSVPVFATYLGGSDYDEANGVAVDSQGNVYVTGSTESKAGFLMVNAAQASYGGSEHPDFYGENTFAGDAFVAKLKFTPPQGSNVSGSLSLVYSTYLGGSGDENGEGVAVDGNGNAYITGFTSSYLDLNRPDARLFPTRNAFQPLKSGLDYSLDAFVTELSASGQLVYSSYYGGSGDDAAAAIALDAAGHVYITGRTTSTNLPPAGASVPQSELLGPEDAFVIEIAADGSKLVYSTYLGGSAGSGHFSGFDIGDGIAVDAAGDAYITGGTSSADFPVTASAPEPLYTGGPGESFLVQDGFVAKLHFDADSSELSVAYATFLGGSAADFGVGIAVDPFGAAYVTGETFSDDFPLAPVGPNQVPLSAQPTRGGDADAFVTKISGDQLTVKSLPVFVNAGQTFSGVVATIRTPDSTYTTADFTTTILWGDGGQTVVPASLSSTSNVFQVSAAHTYASAGAYPITVQVEDLRDGVDTSVINLSHQALNQSEGWIAVDPSNPLRVFAVSNTDQTSPTRALFAAYSADGGLTWTPSTFAGDPAQNLPLAATDPKATFDQFGNLYLTYVGGTADAQGTFPTAVVVLSTDGGKSFTNKIMDYTDPTGVDQPSIATGPSASGSGESLWFTGSHGASSAVFVMAAQVNGLGANNINVALNTDPLPDSSGGSFSDIAVGPAGTVLASYEKFGPDPNNKDSNSVGIYVDPSQGRLNPGAFEPPIYVINTHFYKYKIPASESRELESEPKLAWDRSGGSHNGRVYLVYTDVSTSDAISSKIYLAFSDNGGQTWSQPKVVNDVPGQHSEFLPAISVDQVTGDVVVSWYDTRNDLANTFAEYFAAVSSDGGTSFRGVAQISPGPSSPSNPTNPQIENIEYGDYSGVAFRNGVFYPVFADNSVQLGGNPAGLQFDLATVAVGVATVAPAPITVTGVAVKATEGLTYSGPVATFVDPDPDASSDNYTATIDWGDGAPPETEQPVSQPEGPGTAFEVEGFNVYTEEGDYPIVVTVHNTVTNVDSIPAVDLTTSAGNQSNGTIAVDPTMPDHLFSAAIDESAKGIYAVYSVDGGKTWKSTNSKGGLYADGTDPAVPIAIDSPKATFDSYGNLFLTYVTTIGSSSNSVVLLSIDEGQTFRKLMTTPSNGQLSIAAGPGSVWLTYTLGHTLEVTGAQVSGKNQVGDFSVFEIAPRPPIDGYVADFGDIAIGPKGEVLVTYQNESDPQGPDSIYVDSDPDGLGPKPFGSPTLVTTTQVGSNRPITAQTAGIDAEASLAWDLSNGPHRSRVYLVYTDSSDPTNPDFTTIKLRYSDDDGATWNPPSSMSPIAVGLTEVGNNFLPSVAVDQATGDVGVTWYSDQGQATNVNLVAAVSSDGGNTFSPNVAITAAPSNSTDPKLNDFGKAIGFGNHTQVVFLNGILYPVWADNSPALNANPDRPQFDVAAAAIGVAHVVDAPIDFAETSLALNAVKDQVLHRVVATIVDANSFATAGDFSYTIDWGDGTAPVTNPVPLVVSGQGIFGIVGDHTYTSKKTFPVTITVDDKGGSTVELIGTAKVSGSIDVSKQVTVKSTGTVFNPLTMRWEAAVSVTNNSPNPIDGPIFQVVVTGLPSGTDLVNATGKTSDGNPLIDFDVASLAPGLSLPLAQLVFDAPIQSDFSYGFDVLSDPPPWPDATGVLNTASVGKLLNSVVAVFSGAQPEDTETDYTATIDWGDGSGPSTGVIAADPQEAGEFDVRGTHPFATDGTFATTITITRNDGEQATAQGSTNVAEPLPVVAGVNIAETEGVAFRGVVATFSMAVPNSGSDFSAMVDWGDGTPATVGAVASTGPASYRVEAGHTYESPGTYPIMVSVKDASGRTTTISGTASASAAAGAITYHVVVNTSAFGTGPGFLDFQFNPGSVPGAQPATATVTNLASDGGTLADAHTTGGDASVNSSGSIVLNNTHSLNFVTRGFTAGSSLSFDVTVTGPAVTGPDNGSFGSTFSLLLLAADGITPRLTTDSSGATLLIDLAPDGSTRFTGFPTSVTDAGPVASLPDEHGSAKVAAASLSATGRNVNATEGLPYSGVVATFVSGNAAATADQFHATISWGDGTPDSSGTITAQAGGAFTVQGSHTYLKVGTDPLAVTITESSGTTVTTKASRYPSAILSPAGQLPQSVVVADFNHDGKLDAAVANDDILTQTGSTSYTGGGVSVLLGNGDGTFAPAVSISAGTRPTSVTAADFNGDGNIDLVVASQGDQTSLVGEGVILQGDLRLYLGNGDGTFRSFPGPYPGNGAYTEIATADFDGNGTPDLVVGDAENDAVDVYDFNADGSLQALGFTRNFNVESATAGAFAVGDLNGDGKPDLAVIDSANDSVRVLLNAGSGFVEDGGSAGNGFHETGSFPVAQDPTAISEGDFNGDGKPDLAVASQLGVTILLGKGDGTFSALPDHPLLSAPSAISVADLDGDGKLDLAIATPASNDVNILVGNGDGTFHAPVPSETVDPMSFVAGTYPVGLTVADFNGDGTPDIGVADRGIRGDNDGALGVLIGNDDATFQSVVNEPTPSNFGLNTIASGDFNGDGKLDVVTSDPSADVVDVLLGTGDSAFQKPIRAFNDNTSDDLAGNVVADFNGDGKPDLVAADGLGTLPGNNVNLFTYLGNGDGTFTRGAEIVPNVFTEGMVAGDFNGDGKPDLAVGVLSNSDKLEIIVLPGNDDGTFGTPLTTDFGLYTGFGKITSLAVGDFNGDGTLDLATTINPADGSPGLVDVLLGKGDGSFQAPQPITVGRDPESVVVSDFNRDGTPDLALTDAASNAGNDGREVSVLLGVGNGTFLVSRSLNVGTAPGALASGDFNSDGTPDLVVADRVVNTVSLLLGVGDGTFQVDTFNISNPSDLFALGDFNRDGALDVAVGSAESGIVSVLFSAAGSQSARVAAAPLTATGIALNLTASVPYTGVAAQFSDADPLAAPGDFSATITWGDGHSSPGTVVSDPQGGFDVIGTNTYAGVGSYDVRVDIQDSVGTTAQGISTAVVSSTTSTPLAATGAAPSFASNQDSGDVTVATFTDARGTVAVANDSAIIEWGDGTTSPGTIVPDAKVAGRFDVLGRHTYQTSGDYALAVLISDGVGDAARATSTIDVSPAPATAANGPEVLWMQRFGYHRMRTRIVLRFSEPLDVTTAQDPANYRIIAPGKDGKFGTRDDTRIRVKSAVYDPASQTVTLRPRIRLNVHRRFQVTVGASVPHGVRDLKGRLLDGDRDGLPGGNYKTFLTWRNLNLGSFHFRRALKNHPSPA